MDTFNMEKLFLTGLGGALKMKEHIDQAVEQLVHKGDMTRDQARQFVDNLQSRAEAEKVKVENRGRNELHNFFAENDLAFEEDVQRLESRLDKLAAKLEALETAPPDAHEEEAEGQSEADSQHKTKASKHHKGGGKHRKH
jgi:polyhydroxyalkanoate synthesis regulator phasin